MSDEKKIVVETAGEGCVVEHLEITLPPFVVAPAAFGCAPPQGFNKGEPFVTPGQDDWSCGG